MSKFQSFLAHSKAFLVSAAPVLLALEAIPGPVGKIAAVVVSGCAAVGLFRAESPVGK